MAAFNSPLLGAAHGNHSAVAIVLPLRAFDPPPTGQLAKHGRLISPAFITLAALPPACLLPLGRIDTPKSDPRVSYADRVAVYNAGGPREIGGRGLIAGILKQHQA